MSVLVCTCSLFPCQFFSAHDLVHKDRGVNTLLHRYDPPLQAVRVRVRRPETEIVPDSQQGINHFLQVISALDVEDNLHYPFYVIYSEKWPVPMHFNVRVQGILAGGCLDPFGDWSM